MKTQVLRRVFEEYTFISIGSLITGLGITLFLTPAKIASGGVSGVAILLYHMYKFDPGIVILILSIPIFLFGIWVFGSRYGFKSLFGTIALSVSVAASGKILGYDGVLPYIDRVDILLSALFGGVLAGFGMGIVMKGGANTGGTDIIAQIIHHYTRIPLGSSLFLVDGFVILASVFVFSLESALFAIISLYTTGQVINLITSGTNYAKMAYIISDEYQAIREALLIDMGIGGTAIDSHGMYTNDAKQMIMTVVRNRKITQVSNIVKNIDPKAFMIITNAYEVLGEGFIPLKKSHK